MQASFDFHVLRLVKASYSCTLLSAVLKSLLQKVKHKRLNPLATAEKEERLEVVPHTHKEAHNLKRAATKYKVPMVFSAPCRLAGLCRRVGGKRKTNSREKNTARNTWTAQLVPFTRYGSHAEKCTSGKAADQEMTA